MPKTNSLYTLIKEISQKKGHPLKIVCDWDEVLQPSKPLLVYQISDKKLSFPEFFKHYKPSIWKQPYLYLAFISGVGICLLGMGIYQLFKKKSLSKK